MVRKSPLENVPVEIEHLYYLSHLIADDIELTTSMTNEERSNAGALREKVRALYALQSKDKSVAWSNLRISRNQAVYMWTILEFDLRDTDLTDKEIRIAEELLERTENAIRNQIRSGRIPNGMCGVWARNDRKLKAV